MSLLVGTTDELYLVDGAGFEDPDPVLRAGHVHGLVRASADASNADASSGDVSSGDASSGDANNADAGVLAATDEGLFRSVDGREWTPVETPVEGVTAIQPTPRGTYLGTRPARVYRSTGEGDWRELTAFTGVPGREEWVHGGGGPAQVRSFASHPDAPDRILVGVESAGALLSPDGGDTWLRRDDGLNHDVHHLRAFGPRRFLAATGGGLYRTDDAGRTWVRCDTHVDHFGHRYCRETLVHDGAVYAALAGSGPFWSGEGGADATLVRSTDGGRTLAAEPYPREPEAFVVSWTTWDGRPTGGTNEGSVVVREDDRWREVGTVPVTDRARGAYGVTAMLEL